MRISGKALLMLSAAAAIMPGSVWAQSAGKAVLAEAAPAAELSEVIVTAQQRGENLQRAAVPVSVVSGPELVKAGVNGLASLQKLVPSLQVAAGGQGNLVFIRGVGNFSFLPSSDPAAAFNYDGVYVGRSSSTVGSFFDLERIEVLKGPQGTLYGRNATAGAINVLPVQPKLGEFSGYGTASLGNFGSVMAEGAVNAPVGENAAFRLSADYSKHDGYLKDGTSAEDAYAVRAQFKAEVTPDLKVRLAADYSHTGGVAGGATYDGRFAFNPATGQFDVTPSGIPVDQGLFSPASAAFRGTGAAGAIPGRFLDPLARLPYSNFKIYGTNAQIDWKTPLGTLTVIPAWRHALKDNFNVQSAQNVGDYQTSDQTSLEARLVSDSGGPLDYILGAYYFSEKIQDDTHNSTGAVANFLIASYDTKSPSAYGRLTWHATDRLRFTGGLRYTEDHKTFSGVTKSLGLICTVPTGCPATPLLPYTLTLDRQPVVPATSGTLAPFAPGVLVRRADTIAAGESKTDKITYRGAVEFDVAPRSMLYASIETGYRAGGFNNDAPYRPETITAYTLGLKNRFFDNRLQLNLEAFDWAYKDQQLTFLGIDGLGRVGVITRNIGQSSIKGFEIEGKAKPMANTTLTAALQYVDSNYDSFTYATPARPYSGCKVTGAAPAFVVDCSGKRLFNSPELTANFGVEHVIPMGDLEVVLDADTQYRSSRNVGFEFIPDENVGPTWLSNAQVSLGRSDGRWVAAAFVHNIEDGQEKIFATPVPGSNLLVSIHSTPRTYGLRLSTRF